ncbi:MAG TPA: 50S ribosomal protein L13 [Verrucomicrobiae bacterium]|jgi:large subunit ribosomal protein L13|nr:50S ribosomal protein L13 [Verrucomicrobiae bacterium]
MNQTAKIQKTFRPAEKDFKRQTYLVDASGKTLGRLATKIAELLIGKGKRVFAYDQLSGDQVVVVNAEKVYLSGKKEQDKVHTHYTGYPGGLRTYTIEDLRVKKPEEILRLAVTRMLPNNKLGREMARRLRIYKGENHRQQAQKPVAINL